MGGSFSVGDSFLGGEGTPLGFHLLWWGGIHGVGGTSIMPLPNRANPGLCCNRSKKKHELQAALENLQEKDLNFTIKGTSSQTNFENIPYICAACLFNGWFQTVTVFKQKLQYVLGNFYYSDFISTKKLGDWRSETLDYGRNVPKKKFYISIQRVF